MGKLSKFPAVIVIHQNTNAKPSFLLTSNQKSDVNSIEKNRNDLQRAMEVIPFIDDEGLQMGNKQKLRKSPHER